MTLSFLLLYVFNLEKALRFYLTTGIIHRGSRAAIQGAPNSPDHILCIPFHMSPPRVFFFTVLVPFQNEQPMLLILS